MKLTKYEKWYLNTLDKLVSKLDDGKCQLNQRTGIRTSRLPGVVLEVEPDEPTPILVTKNVMWKSAIEEILWIMQKGSNNIHDLRPHIWDEWADEDGSIGKAYGYQIRTYDQVRNVLTRLSKDSSDRRGVINLWNCADLDEMNLVPCVYSSVWNVIDDELNGNVIQRSGDFGIGVVFNIFQYRALQMMFARHLGVKVGKLTWEIADCHLYENLIEQAKCQLNRSGVINFLGAANCPLSRAEEFVKEAKDDYYEHLRDGDIEKAKEIVLQEELPILMFKENAPTDFWEITIDDFEMLNYNPMSFLKSPIAV